MTKRCFAAFIFCAAVLAACHGGGGSIPPTVSPPQTVDGAQPMATAASSYTQTVLGDHPVQYFQLGETAGPTAADSSPTKVNGQYAGAVTFGVGGPVPSATAVSRPGNAAASVNLLKPNVATGGSYTISDWVYPILPTTVTQTNQYMTIWGYSGTHRLMVSNTGKLLSNLSGSFFSSRQLTSGKWHNVVFVYNASTSTAGYYIDGTLDSSASVSPAAATFSAAYSLGQYDNSGYYRWHGRLGQHAFFPSALSASQIAALYSPSGATPAPTPTPTASYAQAMLSDHPVQYFQLNETSGPTAYDSSTTKANGQYAGAVTYGISGPVSGSTAISLPGTGNDGVSLLKPNVSATSSYTIASWVYPILPSSVTISTRYMTIWGFDGTHRLLVSNTGLLLSQFAGNFYSKGALSSGTWHQVVFVYNASTSTASYYIDGAFDSSATVSNSVAGFTSAYHLGEYDTGVYYKWHGRLAQHAFFPAALTASQISTLYTSAQGSGSPAPSPTPSANPTPTPTPGAGGFYDWTTFAGDNQNTGYNLNEKTLSVSNAPQLHKLWSANFGAPIDAQPIVAANVNAGGTTRSLVFVGAENGAFKAIDASTGATVWSKQLGSYTNAACTDLPMWGVTGTAALNRSANVVYVADGQNQVHALDIATGAEKSGWPINVALVSEEHIYSALTYNPANGLLYVETAGYCDITPYQGRVVAINTSGPSTYQTWRPAAGTTNGGGIWGGGGATIDAATNDVFVATGNVFGSGYGESLVRLSSALAVKASNAPPTVPAGDNDFSGTPMLYQSGSCPQQVDAFNKDGVLYTWSAGSIGSGPTQSIAITSAKSDTEVATYSPATHYIYVTNPQTYGSYNYGVLAFAVQSNCTLSLAWQKSVGISNQNDTSEQLLIANGVAYLTDGWGKAVFALNASNGALLWSSGSTIGNFTFAAPTVDNGHLYVSSYDGNLYAFGP